MIGIMLWLFIIAFVILLGFQINATIDEAKERLRQKTDAVSEEAFLEENTTK